jgi:prepilin-type N-terminal cleavage/methylation domain-containing protein
MYKMALKSCGENHEDIVPARFTLSHFVPGVIKNLTFAFYSFLMRRNGFTLLELSIVLVIIGLVVGGVTVGSELIKSARLQRVSSEVNNYQTAINTFILKYNNWPGDFNKATQYWPTGGTANGDGDGRIEENGEQFRFWEHMFLAGLTTGAYDYVNPVTFGDDLPASAYEGGGYTIDDTSAVPVYTRFGQSLTLGSDTGFGDGFGPLMPSVDASAIDTKMDDGKASSGLVYAERGWDTGSQWPSGCVDGPESATSVNYVLGNTENTCIMIFWFKN